MTTPPLVTLPDDCAASVVMTMSRVVGMTQSPFTLEEQQFQWPGEVWSADFQLPPTRSRAKAAPWIAFGLKLKGTFGRFLMGDPSAKQPRGLVSGPAMVDGGLQVGNELNVKGLTPSVAGILKEGDYFQVGTGITSRLHMVVEDADSDGSGNATLIFEPALRYSPPDSSPVIFENPVGLFRMTDNVFSWGVDTGRVYRIGFTAIEVVNPNA